MTEPEVGSIEWWKQRIIEESQREAAVAGVEQVLAEGGLCQSLMFQQYRDMLTPDPVANVEAAIRYIKQIYGSTT